MINRLVSFLPVILCAFFFTFSCASHPASARQGAPGAHAAAAEPDWSKALPARVAGKVAEGAGGRLCIISSPRSRSRISHYVYGNLRGELEKHYGRYAAVAGRELADGGNPWKKHLLVEKIIGVGDEAPRGFFR